MIAGQAAVALGVKCPVCCIDKSTEENEAKRHSAAVHLRTDLSKALYLPARRRRFIIVSSEVREGSKLFESRVANLLRSLLLILGSTDAVDAGEGSVLLPHAEVCD